MGGVVTAVKMISEQIELRPSYPTVVGNLDYRLLEDQLRRIDEILRTNRPEDDLVEKRLADWIGNWKGARPPSARQQAKYQGICRLAIRCNIARTLMGEDCRGFSVRLAESPLLHWFCGVQRLDYIRVPSKSSIDRFSSWYSVEDIEALTRQLLATAAEADNPLGLEETVDLDCVFLDSTCLKANIHFPVDWVLLRDAVRTLMAAIQCIRRQGLKHRMDDPASFVAAMNRLSIQMTHSRRRHDSKNARKKTLRAMKKMVDRAARHARNYRELLLNQWSRTEWSYAQAQQIIGRLDNVLQQLPQAKRQAHERIIGERQVQNQDKILSLYEPDINVLIRGKAGAEVEFGNGLLLAENPQGLILHWELHPGPAPSDSQQLIPTVEAIEEKFGQGVNTVAGDRAFDSAKNRNWLEERQTFNGTAHRDPKALRRRMKQAPFVDVQRRRAQTEARIGIFQNQFLGRPLRAKGYDHRRRAVAWAALTHNLWVLARLPRQALSEQAQSDPPPAAQAA